MALGRMRRKSECPGYGRASVPRQRELGRDTAPTSPDLSAPKGGEGIRAPLRPAGVERVGERWGSSAET
jgi:hypothetical protein